jgi:DNA replication licensing factor MCM5
MDAVSQGGEGSADGGLGSNRELMTEVNRVEEEIRRRLPIGWSTSLATLRREFVDGRGYSEQAVQRALLVLQRREVVQMRNAGATVQRVGV